MKKNKNYKIRVPKIKYQYAPSENNQEKLANIYRYIFEKTIEKYGFDNLVSLSYNYNKKKGKSDEKEQRNKIFNSSRSFRKTAYPLAKHS